MLAPSIDSSWTVLTRQDDQTLTVTMDWCPEGCNGTVRALQERPPPYPLWTSAVLLVFLGVMILATAVGNILVCLSVWLVRKLRRPSNFLLVSLAVSDLCVALLVMPLALHYELAGDWRLGPTVCDMWVAFDITCCTASILNLCMISVDRYLTITKPLTYGVRRRSRRTWLCIAATWLMSGLVSVPPLLILGNEHGTATTPVCEVSQDFGYQLYATLSSFYIPLLVMVFMYCKIYIAAKRVVESDKTAGHRGTFWDQRSEVFVQLESTSLQVDKKSCACVKDACKSGKKKKRRRRRNKAPLKMSSVIKDRKASITLGIIVTAFIVCWLPFFVVALLRSLFRNGLSVPDAVRSCVLWLGYANSMLNPVIYVTFHHDFRRSFREMLCLRCTTVNETFREETFRTQYVGPRPLTPFG